MHVLVVGAGIAGLAAAWQLKRGGCDVTVVEAAERAGGRIRSAPFHGHVIECGAQFPSSGYRHLMPLFGEAGLDAQLVKTSPWAAFEHRGRLFRVHARRPWTIPASGLLGWRDSVRVSRARAALLARVRALDPNRYAAFAEFDDADAAHWAERAFGRAAVDAIFAPMIHGLYFQPLRGASRALLAAVTGFDGADTLAVAGGWQTLPVALAARLDVRYGTRVDALSAHANGVDACVGDRALRFDAAIVATPATVARRLWRGQTDAQRALLATGYARCAHVAFGLAPGWRAPARLRRVYGALLSPHARRVAALTFERGRGIGDGQGEVVSAMLGHAGAKRYAEQAGIEGETLVAVTSGANMNFDRMRFVAERAEVGEAREAVFAVTIPEERGSFKRFCALVGERNVTEFNYRIADARSAHLFVGVQIRRRDESDEIAANFAAHGFTSVDLSGDELSKQHIRYMVGGRSPLAHDERLFRFEFPERPGALMKFLSSMAPDWNISLFHYRNQGADYSSILVGLQVPQADHAEFDRFLAALGYPFWEESGNPAYRLFLS
ncbi:oxidoreductase [Burkholderia pseudomallei]|nr:FAD-dependent oxidoreductase [Burkholderia pseudomallei]CAJ9840016.1 oxidoreductase [Burkholderia pseudomallei]CPG16774.1 oxidoreductase [Burkholderia pseudomallei]